MATDMVARFEAPLTSKSVSTASVFTCVAFSILVADVILQWQEVRRTRPAARGEV